MANDRLPSTINLSMEPTQLILLVVQLKFHVEAQDVQRCATRLILRHPQPVRQQILIESFPTLGEVL
ncbi:MAG: hypothetical protein ABL986_22470 [Vicinamibacterales bacterium]